MLVSERVKVCLAKSGHEPVDCVDDTLFSRFLHEVRTPDGAGVTRYHDRLEDMQEEDLAAYMAATFNVRGGPKIEPTSAPVADKEHNAPALQQVVPARDVLDLVWKGLVIVELLWIALK